MQYNLCNEPWLKYSMGGVADRGLKHSQWTCARLTADVLYVETHRWGLGAQWGGILQRDGWGSANPGYTWLNKAVEGGSGGIRCTR